MRLSNRNKAPMFNFLLTMTNVLVVVGVVLFFLERSKLHLFGNYSWLFLLIPVVFVALFLFAGRQIFEYDSDGEALNFKNRNVVPFMKKEVRDEFPKYKLISYEVVNMFIIRRLYIKISSKKNNATILKYDISYLTRKEIRDLKISLNKIVKVNKEYLKTDKLVSIE